MGERVEASALVVGHDDEVRRRLQRCVAALQRMVDGGWFIGHEDTVGMEVEFDLVDPLGRPRLINGAVLARLGRADMQDELGQFSVELNLAPRRLQGRVLHDSERDLTNVLDGCRARIERLGARLVAVGMLPTLSAEQLTVERISANPRYALLCSRMRAVRHRPFRARNIDGCEPVEFSTDLAAPDAATTSLQLHLRVPPDRFAAYYNAAQMIAGAQVAVAANSPYLLTRQAWQETRITLCEQLLDTRRPREVRAGAPARVRLGDRWVNGHIDCGDAGGLHHRAVWSPRCHNRRRKLSGGDHFPMTETNERADVTFLSAGARCAGWLYRPANTDGKVPCVVMAHGVALTRHDNLTPYAEALARAGAAVLVYDHRYLGDPEGEPRQRFRMSEHLDDRLAAIAFARTLDWIDPDRIIVWGFSISAGSAIEAAVADARVAGAILLCPFADARWRLNREARVHPRNAVWLVGRAIRDAMIPVAGEPGDHGALTFSGELDGFRSIVAPGWRNEMRSGAAFALWFYRPVVHTRKLKCPVLIQAGQHDITVSARAIDQLAQRAPRAVLKRYDVDHFQPFYGDHPAQIIADQVDWLTGSDI